MLWTPDKNYIAQLYNRSDLVCIMLLLASTVTIKLSDTCNLLAIAKNVRNYHTSTCTHNTCSSVSYAHVSDLGSNTSVFVFSRI